jgi:hypothetical protein
MGLLSFRDRPEDRACEDVWWQVMAGTSMRAIRRSYDSKKVSDSLAIWPGADGEVA